MRAIICKEGSGFKICNRTARGFYQELLDKPAQCVQKNETELLHPPHRNVNSEPLKLQKLLLSQRTQHPNWGTPIIMGRGLHKLFSVWGQSSWDKRLMTKIKKDSPSSTAIQMTPSAPAESLCRKHFPKRTLNGQQTHKNYCKPPTVRERQIKKALWKSHPAERIVTEDAVARKDASYHCWRKCDSLLTPFIPPASRVNKVAQC